MSVSWVRLEVSLPRGPENAPLLVRRVMTIGGMISMGLILRSARTVKGKEWNGRDGIRTCW